MRTLGQAGASILAAFCLILAGCSSSGSSSAGGGLKINVQQGCVKLYGSAAKAVGKNGQPPTGWFCQESGGQLSPVTVADLQGMCDVQHPGTHVRNEQTTDHPENANSQWKCEENSASNTNSVDQGVTVNNGPSVSTMQSGVQFTTVPWFQDLQKCGRPCRLPMYAQPWQTPPAVNNLPAQRAWPCEYYDPNSAVRGPYCLQPPSGRSVSQLGVPGDTMSGDRVLVLCQTTGQPISDDSGTTSDVWDQVAFPKKYLTEAGYGLVKQHPVPGMPGFFEAYAPDIWLLNSSWDKVTNQGSLKIHNIPCNMN